MVFPARDSLDTYGGVKQNYHPVEDPTTDVDANEGNQAFGSVAAMTGTTMFAWARFTTGTSPTLTSTNSNDAAWGSDPSVRPTPAHAGTGIYTLTWPATITDVLGGTQTVNIRRAKAFTEGSSLRHVRWDVTAANVVTLYTFDSAGSAGDISGTVIQVEIG
jgi:hypothetical protein